MLSEVGMGMLAFTAVTQSSAPGLPEAGPLAKVVFTVFVYHRPTKLFSNHINNVSSLVSVIIPVYNRSAYIAKCCRSLFGQTLGSMQFIFVDDGSTDGSMSIAKSILEEYPHRKEQTLFLTLSTHQGVGTARQRGLEAATGEYVIHCDCDDWVEPNMYELLYQKAIDAKADIVTCGHTVESSSGDLIATNPALDATHGIPFSLSPFVGSLCFKLIRREFIQQHNLHIASDVSWGEDLCFSLQALLLAERITSVDAPLYHYIQHSNSITHQVSTQNCLDLIKCGPIIEQFLCELQLHDAYQLQLNSLKFQLKQYFLIFPHVRDLSRWASLFPECHKDLCHYDSPFYLRLSAWLIIHGMRLPAEWLLGLKDRISQLL